MKERVQISDELKFLRSVQVSVLTSSEVVCFGYSDNAEIYAGENHCIENHRLLIAALRDSADFLEREFNHEQTAN